MHLCVQFLTFSHSFCFPSWTVYIVLVIYTFNNFQYIWNAQYWIKIIINLQRDNTHCRWIERQRSNETRTHSYKMINRTEFPMNNGDGRGFLSNNESMASRRSIQVQQIVIINVAYSGAANVHFWFQINTGTKYYCIHCAHGEEKCLDGDDSHILIHSFILIFFQTL